MRTLWLCIFLLLLAACGDGGPDGVECPAGTHYTSPDIWGADASGCLETNPEPLDATRAHLCVEFIGQQPDVTESEHETVLTWDTPMMTRAVMYWSEGDPSLNFELEAEWNSVYCPEGYYLFQNVPPHPVVFTIQWDADGYTEDGTCFSLDPSGEPAVSEFHIDRDPVEGALRLAYDAGPYLLDEEHSEFDLGTRLRSLHFDEVEEEWTLESYLPPTLGAGGTRVFFSNECEGRLASDGLVVSLADPANTEHQTGCRVTVWDGRNADSSHVTVYPPDTVGRAYICASFSLPTR